jgi:hypothetical protein
LGKLCGIALTVAAQNRVPSRDREGAVGVVIS